MDSKHFKTDKNRQIEKMKKQNHPIGFSAFAFFFFQHGILPSSASCCHRTFNRIFTGVCECGHGVKMKEKIKKHSLYL